MQNKKEKEAEKKEAIEIFEKTVVDTLKNTHRNGLAQGAKAMAKVIYDKASDESKTPEERIKYIVEFCEVSLNSKN